MALLDTGLRNAPKTIKRKALRCRCRHLLRSCADSYSCCCCSVFCFRCPCTSLLSDKILSCAANNTHLQHSRMLPGCAQPDFFDSFCTFCPSSVCHRSCVLAVASSRSVCVSATHRVVQALPEPPMPARVIWGIPFLLLRKSRFMIFL